MVEVPTNRQYLQGQWRVDAKAHDALAAKLVRCQEQLAEYKMVWVRNGELKAQNSRLRGAIEDYLDGEMQGNVTGLRQALEAAREEPNHG